MSALLNPANSAIPRYLVAVSITYVSRAIGRFANASLSYFVIARVLLVLLSPKDTKSEHVKLDTSGSPLHNEFVLKVSFVLVLKFLYLARLKQQRFPFARPNV